MKLIQSPRFKKDLKKLKGLPKKIAALQVVLGHLSLNGKLPIKYKPHMLEGKWKGYMECHVENDFLLIWIDEATDTIKLVRVGSHSDLFKK